MTKADAITYAKEFGKAVAYGLAGHHLARKVEGGIIDLIARGFVCILSKLKHRPKKKEVNMLSKTIPLGSIGSLSLVESAGMVSVTVSVSGALGGGSVAGAAKGSVSASVDVSALELIDAGLVLAQSKYPSLATVIGAAKAAIDAELAKA